MTIETATLPAAGSKILVDKISPDRLAQLLKLAVGAEGVLTLVSSDAGNVDAGTLRITLAGDDAAVTALQVIAAEGATAEGQGNLLAAVALEATAQLQLDELGEQTTHLATIATAAASTDPAETKLTKSTPYFNGAVSSTKHLVATGPQVLTDYFLYNPDAAAVGWLQMFNAASTGDVTLGTTQPVRSIPLAGLQKSNLAGLALSFPLGLVIAGTTTATGSTTATTALVVNLGVKDA